MVISFLDGTHVAEPGVENALKHRLSKLIKQEDAVTFYFYTSTEFMLQCEWITRKLQAAFPKKCIERVGVITAGDAMIEPPCRFDRYEFIEYQAASDIWRWMVDQSDYVCSYMHPLLCTSRFRLAAWNYATRRLQDNCLNFATEEAWTRICEQIPTLPPWQRSAFEMKLRKERRSESAKKLGVSRSTARIYESAAQHSLERKAFTPEAPHRQCAVLGIVAAVMSEEQKKLLFHSVRYLVCCCGVNHFIVQNVAIRRHTPLLGVLMSMRQIVTSPIRISTLEQADTAPELLHINRSTGRISRGLEERKTLIDSADIVLCSIEHPHGSGLYYAKKKHIPVINLADSNYCDGRSFYEGQSFF